MLLQASLCRPFVWLQAALLGLLLLAGGPVWALEPAFVPGQNTYIVGTVAGWTGKANIAVEEAADALPNPIYVVVQAHLPPPSELPSLAETGLSGVEFLHEEEEQAARYTHGLQREWSAQAGFDIKWDTIFVLSYVPRQLRLLPGDIWLTRGLGPNGQAPHLARFREVARDRREAPEEAVIALIKSLGTAQARHPAKPAAQDGNPFQPATPPVAVVEDPGTRLFLIGFSLCLFLSPLIPVFLILYWLFVKRPKARARQQFLDRVADWRRRLAENPDIAEEQRALLRAHQDATGQTGALARELAAADDAHRRDRLAMEQRLSALVAQTGSKPSRARAEAALKALDAPFPFEVRASDFKPIRPPSLAPATIDPVPLAEALAPRLTSLHNGLQRLATAVGHPAADTAAFLGEAPLDALQARLDALDLDRRWLRQHPLAEDPEQVGRLDELRPRDPIGWLAGAEALRDRVHRQRDDLLRLLDQLPGARAPLTPPRAYPFPVPPEADPGLLHAAVVSARAALREALDAVDLPRALEAAQAEATARAAFLDQVDALDEGVQPDLPARLQALSSEVTIHLTLLQVRLDAVEAVHEDLDAVLTAHAEATAAGAQALEAHLPLLQRAGPLSPLEAVRAARAMRARLVALEAARARFTAAIEAQDAARKAVLARLADLPAEALKAHSSMRYHPLPAVEPPPEPYDWAYLNECIDNLIAAVKKNGNARPKDHLSYLDSDEVSSGTGRRHRHHGRSRLGRKSTRRKSGRRRASSSGGSW